MSADASLMHPAVFAGKVLSVENGMAIVLNGLKSYNDGGIPDSVGRPGMSGGEVVNSYGELVGLSNYGHNLSWLDTMLNTQIGPFGLPGSDNGISVIDIVSNGQVLAMEHRAEAAPACVTPNNDIITTLYGGRLQSFHA
jgi:hypothetical protein